MPDDEVPVHDVDDQDASGAHELRILLEDLDVRVFVVVPEGRPEVERAVEWRGARRHALRETSQVSDVKRRSTGHALTISEFDCARDEHRRKVYAHGLVAHLRETGRMPSDAAGGVEDSAIRGNAKPLQDGMEVARLLLARGPRVLVDREEHLRMAEEQVFGPVDSGHWLAMWLALFGGVLLPRAASPDDGGLVFRRAAGGIVCPELEGAMLVRQSLAVHLRADRRLEFRPACMAGTRGHRPAPSIASTIARANTEVRTSLAPGMKRARSYVTTFDPTTVFTADRSRMAASRHPRYSSIITPARISAVGLTLSIPAYFGALPWTGSNSARASPMFPPAATPNPPIWAAAASLR